VRVEDRFRKNERDRQIVHGAVKHVDYRDCIRGVQDEVLRSYERIGSLIQGGDGG
jgi:hypothetical protein